jgi:hypothetical protein
MWWMAYKIIPVPHAFVLPWLIWWLPFMVDERMAKKQLRFINGK